MFTKKTAVLFQDIETTSIAQGHHSWCWHLIQLTHILNVVHHQNLPVETQNFKT
jgi:hypothetical protein